MPEPAPDDELALPPIERLQVVQVQPDDTVIATVGKPISPEQARRLQDGLERHFPDQHIVIASGFELSVQRPEDAE